MMQLFLAPVDVWLFRDGRPFDAGSDHRATSVFPPYSSVMQGVIRSHHLVVKNVDLTSPQKIEEEVGTATDFKNLRLVGPFVARWDGSSLTRYFPVPADMSPQEKQYVPLEVKKIASTELVTSVSTKYLLFSRVEPSKKSPGEWLDEDNLLKALQGNPVSAVSNKELFERESRFGIGIEEGSRVTKETALYEVEFIRPGKNVGLYLEVTGYEGWPSTGLMRIGGEGRGATFEILKEAGALRKKFTLKKELPSVFKVYFATPAYFKKGWLPENWEKYFDGQVELITAAVNRYESIGGFDWALSQHKPTRRFVPAGSVYYFRSEGLVYLKDQVLELGAITDEGAQIGFGQVFIQEVHHV